jgi:DNA-directed RNA polymerase sigma subunit (sigma70/sigma32)
VDYKNKLTRDDAIFFMDMIEYVWGPNFAPKLYKVKPYTKILNDKNSNNFKRFIRLYKSMSHVLSERELIILDEVYGVNKESTSLKKIAELLNISPERVRQLRNGAENKIGSEILVKLKDDTIENC